MHHHFHFEINFVPSSAEETSQQFEKFFVMFLDHAVDLWMVGLREHFNEVRLFSRLASNRENYK